MKKKKEIVYKYVDLKDDIAIQKLTLLEQIIVVLKRLLYDESIEMKKDDALAVAELELRDTLITYVQNCCKPLREGVSKNVIFTVHSKFGKYLKEVLSMPRFINYYDIYIETPELEYDIEFFYRVKIEVKSEIK